MKTKNISGRAVKLWGKWVSPLNVNLKRMSNSEKIPEIEIYEAFLDTNPEKLVRIQNPNSQIIFEEAQRDFSAYKGQIFSDEKGVALIVLSYYYCRSGRHPKNKIFELPLKFLPDKKLDGGQRNVLF